MRRAISVFSLLLTLGIAPGAAAPDIITTFAGGGPNNLQAIEANLGSIIGIAADSAGNFYVAQHPEPARTQHRVFKVDAAGQLTVVAGNGTFGFSGDGGLATSASLARPRGVAVDSAGNIFIVDFSNQRIRRVDASSGIITTVAGTGTLGFSGDGGSATSARLGNPFGVAVDAAGNLFIADQGGLRIRRVDALTGIITTVAGTGIRGFGGDGGPATSARLNAVSGMAVDSAGNLFIADRNNQRIRRVDASSGFMSTVAGTGTFGFSGDGGPASSARLANPFGVAVDGAGNLFISDSSNERIRRVDGGSDGQVTRRSDEIITTVAGTGIRGFSGDGGPATSASLSSPLGAAVDSAGNLFIADRANRRIRRVDAGGTISTVAGNGTFSFSGDGRPATSASLGNATGVAVDSAGNLFIADRNNQRIRRVDASSGIITTVAGNGRFSSSPFVSNGDGGPATSASVSFRNPTGVAVDSFGNIFIADRFNNRIRRVDGATGIITTVAGNGSCCYTGDGFAATSARFNRPFGVAVDGAGNLLIADVFNQRIRRVDASSGIITTVAGNGIFGFSGDGGPATSASLAQPSGVAVDGAGNIFIADPSNHRIRKVDTSRIITTVAGNGVAASSGDGGPATSASLRFPGGVAVDAAGNLFIAVGSNNRIRRVDGASGIITTVAGNGIFGFSGDGGLPTSARLAFPSGVALDSAGNLFIADRANSRIRRVSVSVSAPNQPPAVTLFGPNTVIEGDTATYDFTVSDPEDSTFTVKAGFPDCGIGGTLASLTTTPSAGRFQCFFPDGPASPNVAIQVTDPEGAESNLASISVNVANLAPVVTSVSGPADPLQLGSEASVTANFTDAGVLDSHECTFSWDDETPQDTILATGTGDGSCTATHAYTAAGVYKVTVVVEDKDAASDIGSVFEIFITSPPDLTLISSDISFSPVNPGPGQPVAVNVAITNQGLLDTSDIQVSFFDFDTPIGDTTITTLSAGATTEVSLQATFPEEGFRLITVKVDPSNTILELREDNNEASLVLQVGQPMVSDAVMFVQASTASACRGGTVSVNGRADYDFASVLGAADFPVQGGLVTVRVLDPSVVPPNVSPEFTGAHTLVSGAYGQVIVAPTTDGTYTLEVSVTDETLTGTIETTLTVSGECSAGPTPFPPGGGGGGGGGGGSSPGEPGSPGEPAPNTPPPAAGEPPDSVRDIFVFSRDIGVSKLNPALGEEIVVLSVIHYFGVEPALDVPVTINDIFPFAGKLRTFKIRRTRVSFECEAPPEAPLEAPRCPNSMVPVPWTSTTEGAHIIQVVTEPPFDQFTGNDAATRLFFIGEGVGTIDIDKSVALLVDADANGAFSPGDTLKYTITFTNTGTAEITGAVIIDGFDERFVGTPSKISDGGAISDGTISWNVGSIAVGPIGAGTSGSVTYEVNIKPLAEFPTGATIIANTAFLTTDQTVPIGTTAEVEVVVVAVEIDIKPGSFPNSINLGSGGTVPMAILSSIDFDATTVDPTTVTLAGAAVKLRGKAKSMASFEDVNGDSLMDIVVHVITEALELSETDTAAILAGRTFDGTLIRGTDTVRIVPQE